MTEGESQAKLTIRLSSALKNDIDTLARMKGKNISSIVREALKQYVQKEYYEKAEDILNIEKRIGGAIFSELYPQLEEIKSRLDMIADMMQSSQAEKSPEKEEVVDEEEKEEGEVDFPKIPGLRYKVDGKNVIYEDGSVYSRYLGAWLITKDEVLKWKRKKEKERNLLR